MIPFHFIQKGKGRIPSDPQEFSEHKSTTRVAGFEGTNLISLVRPVGIMEEFFVPSTDGSN
jgi:hypothetical protein